MDTLFKKIFDSAPDAMIVVNQEGEITISNDQAKRIFGYENDNLDGVLVESLIPHRHNKIHKLHRENYNHHPHLREMGKGLELSAKRKDGSEFFVEISLSPVSINDELFVAAAIRDVTEKREMLRQLKQQQDLSTAQNNRLLNFAYIVSHNLRSHSVNLGIMLSFFENAGTLKEKEEIMAHLKAISFGLSDTIKHLNDVASTQIDVNVNRELVNLKSYITKTEEILSGEIQAKEGLIINNVPEEINFFYNPAYLESILLNFVSNAIKYSHPNRNPLVSLNSYKEGERVILEIQDNGLGIDLEKHGKNLFGLNKTFHGNRGARGVGLFISKNQIEALGGNIQVQSKVGTGTTFKISLT